jgi:hypothetical protein
MLANQAQACELQSLLTAASAANTAAATGTAIDISKYEGDLMVTQVVGVLTGTLDGKLQSCDDSGGTNAADISGAAFAQVTTSNDNPNVQKITVPAGSLPAGQKFLRYVGTIVTGPAIVGVVLHSHPKYT